LNAKHSLLWIRMSTHGQYHPDCKPFQRTICMRSMPTSGHNQLLPAPACCSLVSLKQATDSIHKLRVQSIHLSPCRVPRNLRSSIQWLAHCIQHASSPWDRETPSTHEHNQGSPQYPAERLQKLG